MKERIRAFMGVLRDSSHPFRLIFGVILMKSGLNKLFTIKMDGYRLKFSRSALALSLFADAGVRHEDEEVIKKVLKPGDIYVDTGANIGTLALTAARVVGNEGKVIAIEPHPVTFKYLKSNVDLNHFRNVVLIHSAAGKEKGSILFSDINSDDQNRVATEGNGIRVPVDTLDNLLRDTGRVNLLKIDVEGYEKMVLEGGRQTLERTDVVLYESWEKHHNNYGYTTRSVTAMMNGMGFSVFRFAAGGIERISENYTSENCENLLGVRNEIQFSAASGINVRL